MGLFSPKKVNKPKQQITRSRSVSSVSELCNSPCSSKSVIDLNKNKNAIDLIQNKKLNVKTNKTSVVDSYDNNKKTESNESMISIDNKSENTMASNSVQTGMDRYVTVISSKRKASPLANNVLKTLKSNDEITTSNKFEVLGTISNDEMLPENVTEKPPPIYLREKSSPELIKLLKECVGNDFFIVPMKKGLIEETKIQLRKIENFRMFRDTLDAHNKHYYTYQLKSARGLSVVIKGLESDTNTDEIKEDLEHQGFKVKNIMNIFNKNKAPQPMFKVELEVEGSKTEAKNHPIYKLRYVLYRKISVEEPHKRKSVLQCFKCQEYGHTKGYCKLQDVCVICGALHNSANCTLEKNSEQKKCNNCGGNHTANYKGCQVYKIYQEKLQFRQRKDQISINRTFKIDEAKLRPGVSFAECVQGSKQSSLKNNEVPSPLVNDQINELTRMMCEFMKSMERNMSQMLENMNMMMQLMIKNQK